MKSITLIAFLFLASSVGFGVTLKSLEITGGKTNEAFMKVETNAGMLCCSTVYEGLSMSTTSDFSQALMKWEYSSSDSVTDIVVEREGDSVLVKGKIRRDKAEKKLKMDSNPWYQYWGASLTGFAAANTKSEFFWSMQVGNVNDIAKFKAVKDGETVVTIGGTMEPCIHVKVFPDGMMADLFWHADFWYAKSDGRLVMERMARGMGVPPTTVEYFGAK